MANTTGTSINLSTGVIDTKNFKVSSTGSITATGGTIGGCTIDSTGIYSGSSSNTAGIGLYGSRQAFWAGASASNSSSAPFRVDHAGNLTATNANINGTITATSGTFDNCTIKNTCSVPASTVTGTLASSNIPNLNASKITTGTLSGINIHGCTITGGTMEYTNTTISTSLQLGSSVAHPIFSLKVGSNTGQTTSINIGGYTLSFYCGILIGIS